MVASHAVVAKEIASPQFRVVYHLKVYSGAVRDTKVCQVLFPGIEIAITRLWVHKHAFIT